MADLDDLSEYLPGRSRKPDPPRPAGAPAQKPAQRAPRPAGGVGAAPVRPGRPGAPGKKPAEPAPPPTWRRYMNNPAVVASLFAIAVLAFVTQVPGMFRARPPYETHPCCGMKFYSCECGCQTTPSACTCANHKVITGGLPPGAAMPAAATPASAVPASGNPGP